MVSLKKYQTYESFRAVEDAWLNSLPSDWKLTRLQFGSSIRNSGVDKKIVEGEELIKLCNYVDVYYHDTIDDSIDFMEASATPEEIEKFRLRKGDVIMTKDSESPNDIGIPAFVSKDFDNVICGYHLCVLKTFRDKLDPKFLFYFLKSTFAQSKFEIYSNGVTRFGLSYNGIKTLPVPVPSLKEQEYIANFLDQKAKQIDYLIEQKENLLKLLTEKRKAVITHTVTKGLNPKVKMKDSGIKWLGEVPEHWNVKKLKFISTILNSNVDKKSIEGEREARLCNYVDVYYNDEITSAIDFMIATCSEEEYSKFSLKAGDVLITKDSESPDDIGVPSIVKENLTDLVCGYHLSMIRPKNDRINGGFLNYFLRSILSQAVFEVQANGVTRFGLPLHSIKSHLIPLPPIDEQGVITEYLDTVVKRIAKVIIATSDSIERLKEYRSSIVTSAVTGKIDVRKEVVA